jgi:hypothetical protein
MSTQNSPTKYALQLGKVKENPFAENPQEMRSHPISADPLSQNNI